MVISGNTCFGCKSFEDESEKEKLDMFVNAFKRTGCRAVIQGFQKTMQNYELPETMIACGSVPIAGYLNRGNLLYIIVDLEHPQQQ